MASNKIKRDTLIDYVILSFFVLFKIFITIAILIGFYSITRITINEYYMRLISYDVVECNIDLKKTKQYRNSKDYLFKYNYKYIRKSYEGSGRIDNHEPKTKLILSGKQNIELFVSPIHPSYSVLTEPTLENLDDWFIMGFMTILFVSIWTLPFQLLKSSNIKKWKIPFYSFKKKNKIKTNKDSNLVSYTRPVLFYSILIYLFVFYFAMLIIFFSIIITKMFRVIKLKARK